MRPPYHQKRDTEAHRHNSGSLMICLEAANRSLPFFKLLKKGLEFEWINECEQVLTQFKIRLSEPSIIIQLVAGKPFTYAWRS